MAPLTVETTTTGAAVHVALAGELDVQGAAVLNPELRRIATEPGPAAVVVDLRGLRFMDSSGLRSLMMADEALRAAGRRLALVRGGAEVQRVFAVTRMDERLTFVADPAAGEAPA